MTVDGSDDGVVRMDDDEMRGFLASQHVGVLGLPADGAPSMRPMSYWFDGESCLYFLYVVGERSRKDELSVRADVARFLVYRAETPFLWESVLLTGSIDEVTGDDRDAVVEAMDLGRRPEAFERLGTAGNTKLYRLEIDERTGLKQTGLPPEFEPN